MVFAIADGELESLEGRVSYQAGDAILTGATGERWPVRRTAFLRTYQPVAGVVLGAVGQYTKRPLRVLANQLAGPRVVRTSHGLLHGAKGDWLIRDPEGDEWVVAEEIFNRDYVVIEDC